MLPPFGWLLNGLPLTRAMAPVTRFLRKMSLWPLKSVAMRLEA